MLHGHLVLGDNAGGGSAAAFAATCGLGASELDELARLGVARICDESLGSVFASLSPVAAPGINNRQAIIA